MPFFNRVGLLPFAVSVGVPSFLLLTASLSAQEPPTEDSPEDPAVQQAVEQEAAEEPAQQGPQEAVEGLPRVYFDCQGPQCDSQYYRTEITWVNWVRDPQDAHVHVFMTSEGTAAGGREYQIDFEGREDNADYREESYYRSISTDTQRERLDELVHTLGLGLAQFANRAGFRGVVRLEGTEGGGGVTATGLVNAAQVDDPWNLWVFRINGNGNLDKESTSEDIRLRGGVSASRVTPTWKLDFSSNVNYRGRERALSDGEVFEDRRTDWGINSTVVYSVAQHWSVGFSSRIGRNTSQNQHAMAQFNPALEYSYFPYEDATRRSLTAFYEVGPVYRGYIQETLELETEQLLAEQRLTVDFSQRQQWGDASLSIEGSNYLHDFQRNRLELRGNLSFRIFRGLNLNSGASYARVRDQIYLPLEDLTDEERLLQLSQEGTDYEASLFLGLSFQFGSIYNNVVNNRFPGGGRGPF